MINANFIPPARLTRARVQRLVRVWGIFLACYGAVLLIALPAGRMAMALPTSADIDARQRAEQRVKTATADRAKLRNQLTALAQRIEAADTAGNHPDHSLLLGALARVRGDDAAYSRISFVVEQSSSKPAPIGDAKSKAPQRNTQRLRVVISGTAGGPSKIFELAQRLEALGVFSQVNIVQTRANSAPGEGQTAFELEAIADELEEPQSP
jgi:hypothetical protein